MKRFLITQSLLSSWQRQWANFDKYGEKADEFREKAKADFLDALCKEPIPTSEAMQKGIDFENLVTDICAGRGDTNHKWYEAACKVASEVRNGQFQAIAVKEVTVFGIDFLLYGRLDYLKAGVITDIKYTGKYEVGKFFDSPQHPMYMELVPEAYEFRYLVSDGRRVWREVYSRGECRPIYGIMQDFVDYLQIARLMPVYMQHWKAKG